MLKEPIERTCVQCGDSFTTTHPAQKHCSATCRRKARSPRADNCVRCGKPNHQHKSQFCSRECYDNFRTESRAICPNCGGRVKGGGVKGGYKYCCHACKVAHKKPQPRPCVNCGTVFTPVKYNTTAKRFVANNAGKTCSPKCQKEWNSNNEERKLKIGRAFKGANHPNWQGGKSALNNVTHRGSGWLAIAEKARVRDKHVCQCCGKTQEENGRKLDVHHVTPYHDVNDTNKANKLSNLVSLCRSCHKKEDAKLKERQLILPFAMVAREKRRKARAVYLALS